MIKNQFKYLLPALLGLGVLPVLAQEATNDGAVAQAVTPTPPTQATDSNGNTATVRIDRFVVKGNTLLYPRLIDKLLNPFKGEARGYTDIQLALEALEGGYRSAGYSAVHVVTPEQEITEGTVTFQVIETVIGKVVLKGNHFYDKKNIRNALPALIEGSTPSARKLSENIQLANQNPTRQLDVVLALGEEENTVDAEVNVQDSPPHKLFVTLDNTGSSSTGMLRTGVGYQNNNLFNRDQALTLNYVTSPTHVKDVTQLSASYRLPIYALGDSVDLLTSYSDTNAGTTSVGGQSAASLLTYSGKGRVFGAHYNHYLPRRGDFTSRIIGGLDYRMTINNCLLGNIACPATPDINLLPSTVSYGGTLTKPTTITDFTTSVVHNFPGGSKGGTGVFNVARKGARADYNILKLNGSLAGVLPLDWQYRFAGNTQYGDALIASEKLGLAGSSAVRGFIEREFSNDQGYVLNFELYTPELAQRLKIKNGSLRFLGFVDRAAGWDKVLQGEAATAKRTSLGSVGVGFRLNPSKNVTIKLDVAKVSCGDNDGTTCSSSNISSRTGNTRGHLSVMANW